MDKLGYPTPEVDPEQTVLPPPTKWRNYADDILSQPRDVQVREINSLLHMIEDYKQLRAQDSCEAEQRIARLKTEIGELRTQLSVMTRAYQDS